MFHFNPKQQSAYALSYQQPYPIFGFPVPHHMHVPQPSYDPYNPYHNSPLHSRGSSFDPYFTGDDMDDSSSMMDANSYRRLALEHQRKAEVALALAQEQEMRNKELQRQLALDRLRNELGYHNHQQQQQEQPSAQHVEEGHRPAPHHHSPFEHPLGGLPSYLEGSATPRRAMGFEAPRRVTLEDEIRHFLQRRDQEREEVLKVAPHINRAQQTQQPTAPASPRPQPRLVVPTAGATSQRLPTGRLQSDLASQLRAALSGGRSNEEKDVILRELGLAPLLTQIEIESRRPEPQHLAEPVFQQKLASPKTVRIPIVSSSEAGSRVGTPSPTAATATTRTATEPTTISSPSLASLDAIQSQFDTLKSSFVFPPSIDFSAPSATTSSLSSSSTPRLLYNQANASVLHYESELIKLLTKLDAVQSGGAESVRGARKALVLAIEKELDALDGMKMAAWKRQSGGVAQDEEAEEQAKEESVNADAGGVPEYVVEEHEDLSTIADMQGTLSPVTATTDVGNVPATVEQVQHQQPTAEMHAS